MLPTPLLWILCPLLAATAAAQHWPQFRGPGSRGIAVGDAPLPDTLDPAKNLVFKQALPPGNSSPCIWDKRIFLTAAQGQHLTTLCLDRDTGTELWRRSVKVPKLERAHRINSPASPTPACNGEQLISYFGSFGLLAYSLDGQELWRKELKYPGNIFGTAASPILAGDKLILNRDTHKQSFLFALDPATGKEIWKKDRSGFASSWSTPVVWNNQGVDELLIYGAFRLTAYDLKDCSERWSVPGLADEPCITPVTGEGLVFVSSYNMRTNPEVIGVPQFGQLLAQYDRDKSGTLDREEIKDNKSILSRLDADGEGDHPLRGFFRFLDADKDGLLTGQEWQKMFRWLGSFKHANAVLAIRPGDGQRDAEILWQHPHAVPECPSLLYHQGKIYTIKNGGLASCLDARTGKQHYQARLRAGGPRYSSPVVGDGKIYGASARGMLTIHRVGEKLEVLHRHDLGERIMATPALLDGRVYVRTEAHLWVFGS